MVNFKVTGHCINHKFKLLKEDLGVALRQLVRNGSVHEFDALRSCPSNRLVLLADTSESAIKGQKKALPAQQLRRDELIGFRRLSKHCLNPTGIFTSEGNKLACSKTGNTEHSIKWYQFIET